MITYEITNEELFNQEILDLDLTELRFRGTDCKGKSLGFFGSIGIETYSSNGWLTTTGEFGENDYSEEFGFKITTIIK